MTLAVFECPDADEASFDLVQYGRAGAVIAVDNDQASRLLNWNGVTMYRDHARVAVVLAWNTLRNRYVIVGSYIKEPSDEKPDITFLSGTPIPGVEEAGYVEITTPRPFDPVLRPADLLLPEDAKPDTEKKTAEPKPEEEFRRTGPDVQLPSDVFSPMDYCCPFCDFRGPTSHRITRHIEFQHTSEHEDESEQTLAEAERSRVERETAERIKRRADDPPPAAPWDRELARLPDDEPRGPE